MTAACNHLYQRHPELSPYDPGGALKAFNGGIAIVRIKDAIELRAAGVHQFSHPFFRQLFFFISAAS